jgi:NADPH2:quinone reductase
MQSPSGAFAEYALSESCTTAHLPRGTSFESAATLPLAALTSVNGLHKLNLPNALSPRTNGSEGGDDLPLLIYGGSTAVGAFAIQLAKLAGISPIIALAGSGCEFAKNLGADIVIDRRQGNVVENIEKALNGRRLNHVFDTISEGDSITNITELLESVKGDGAVVTHVLPVESYGQGVKTVRTMVACAYNGTDIEKDLGYTFIRLFGKWMREGRFKAHPYEVVEGGLNGVEEGLRRLQRGEVSSKKLVFRVSDEQ